ncbi:GNAT family N-acetyltransferase [Chitinophaga sp. Cy-1792]|uniref:GNAT family N-acetyltransferase n=1 Tax=Chitinophaga sp. Cy-1792 TaxID=2608339 RepID=UPI0014232FE5|nr:GNAT family protein [Chitinophaga sp. Cy-1792]NIG52888.1 GNAT family N-acetyltransferase [Chitinophaga sp. Cy-1792]
MRHFLPNGEELVIREARLRDAANLLSNYQRMTTETDYLLLTPQEALELDAESEEAFIKAHIDKHRQLLLVATVNDRIIGAVNVDNTGHDKRPHIGEMGIGVAKAYHGMGVGRRLMTAMLRWAEQHEDISLLYLQVAAANERAMQLYRNFDFHECGRLPDGIQLRPGIYSDLVTMYRRV